MNEYFTRIDGFEISVDKVGGGTLGRSYVGEWEVTVQNGPVYELDNDMMVTGTPKTHSEVARMAANYVSEDM